MNLQPNTPSDRSQTQPHVSRVGSPEATEGVCQFNPADEVFVVDAIAEEPPFRDIDFRSLPSLRDIQAAQQWLIEGADWQRGAIPVTRVLREFLLHDDRSVEMHQLRLLTVAALDERRNWESLATLVDGFYATTEEPHERELQLAIVGALAQFRSEGLWTPESFRLLCELSKRHYSSELRLIAIPAIAHHGKWAFPYLGAALDDESFEIYTAAQRALLPYSGIKHTVEPLLVLYGMLDPSRPGVSEFRRELCEYAQYYPQHIPIQPYVKVLLKTLDGLHKEGAQKLARKVIMTVLNTDSKRYAPGIAQAFSELSHGAPTLQAEAVRILQDMWREAGVPREYQLFTSEDQTESRRGQKKEKADHGRHGKEKGGGRGRSRGRGRGKG